MLFKTCEFLQFIEDLTHEIKSRNKGIKKMFNYQYAVTGKIIKNNRTAIIKPKEKRLYYFLMRICNYLRIYNYFCRYMIYAL